MGILPSSKEDQIIQLIRLDKPAKLKEFLLNNNINPDELYTKRKRTLIQLCCYYSSPKCLSKLISMNYDYNKKELSNNYTPLYIACKFNCLKIVKILLDKDDCDILQKTNDNYNELEIAFLKGNYDICYYLLYEYKNKKNDIDKKMKLNENKEKIDINIKVDNNNEIDNNDINGDDIYTNLDVNKNNEENKENKEIQVDYNQPYQNFFFSDNFKIDYYYSLQSTEKFPIFNMKLFYASLINRISPEECQSFAAERKRTKDLLTKVPDPNETWGHFFKRLANMELYNPPLVDKRNVTEMNSLYMNAQMRLLENEYGVKMGYYKSTDETKNIDAGEEEDEPILRVENTEKKRLKEESQTQTQIQNNIRDSENVNLNSVIQLEEGKKGVKERKPEEIKIGNNNNICVVNINNNNSSDRKIKNEMENEEENQ